MNQYAYRINEHTLIAASNPILAILKFIDESDNLDVTDVTSLKKVF